MIIKPVVRKTIGVLLLMAGVAIFLFVLQTFPRFEEVNRNDKDFINVLTIVLAGAPLSLFLFVIGGFFATHKKMIIEEHSSNPLICSNCKLDYDTTWKVCLKCGKPLIEKQNFK